MNDNGIKAAEFRGKVIESLKHINQKLEVIETQHKDDKDKLHVRIDDHVAYHKKNEFKWGFWTLLKQRPLIAIIIWQIIFRR